MSKDNDKGDNQKSVKRLFSIREAGIYLGRSPWTVAEMVRTGKLPYVPDGRRKLLDIQDLNKWIETSKVILNENGRPTHYPYQNFSLDK